MALDFGSGIAFEHGHNTYGVPFNGLFAENGMRGQGREMAIWRE